MTENDAGDGGFDVGVDKFYDFGEWERKSLIDVDKDEYEWLRRGIKGGAGAGMIVCGLLGLCFSFLLVVSLLGYGGHTLEFDRESLEDWGVVALMTVVFALAGAVVGGVAGVAACRLIKGKSWWYRPLSKVVGAVGGIVVVVIGIYIFTDVSLRRAVWGPVWGIVDYVIELCN